MIEEIETKLEQERADCIKSKKEKQKKYASRARKLLQDIYSNYCRVALHFQEKEEKLKKQQAEEKLKETKNQ